MRSYGQYCPIARASEILAERWTPIILRNILNGAHTFTGILQDAPGLSRSVLVSRLRELERIGIIGIAPSPDGRGSRYTPTEAGHALRPVIGAMGVWAEQWLELRDDHVDPGLLLHSWCRHDLAVDLLPDSRVVVRFDLVDQATSANRLWFLFDGEQSEVCAAHPGFEEDLHVTTTSRALTEWHLGRLTWGQALRGGDIRVRGPDHLARALPTWNRRTIARAVGAG